MNDYEFFMWYQNATQEERFLSQRVSELLVHFDDMLFKPRSVIDPFIKVNVNGSIGYDENPYLSNFNTTEYVYSVKKLDGDIAGYFSNKDKTLCISPEYLHGDATILHEMIHMIECYLEDFPKFYHDAVLLSLYNDLKGKIPDIDHRIVLHTHLYRGEEITAEGGNHDILFLLKSFDLDLRLGHKLGTVCGYGRDELC